MSTGTFVYITKPREVNGVRRISDGRKTDGFGVDKTTLKCMCVGPFLLHTERVIFGKDDVERDLFVVFDFV